MFIPHLTRWLRLPGKAGSPEPVWVSPPEVKPDEPGLVREDKLAGYYLVHDWFHDPDHFEPLEEMFVFLGGELHPNPCSVGDRIDPLVRAFDEERLWLWRVPVFAVAEPAVFPAVPVEPTPAAGPLEPTGSWRLLDFWLARADGSRATHVASGAENPKPQFKWVLDDPDNLVTGGRLEFYRADAPELSGPFATLSLSLDQLLSLRRPFNGFTGASYLSCEWSPYRVRLVVEGLVGPPQALNYPVRVEPTRLDLQLGPRSMLSNPKDLDTYDILAGYESFDGDSPSLPVRDEHALLPFPSSPARVVMRTHLFAAGPQELELNSNASFEALEYLWEDGPEVPLVASLFFRASDGSERLAPRAWGNQLMVWEWTEAPEDTTMLANAVRAVLNAARDYKTAEPKPNSQLCHSDRGGKRGITELMFGVNSRWPGSVRHTEGEPTVARTPPVETGDLLGRSGLIFRPPRQSGEHLSVAVSFNPGSAAPETPTATSPVRLTATSPIFQTWHSIELNAHYAKRPDGEGIESATLFSDLSGVRRHFEPAYTIVRRLHTAPRRYLDSAGDVTAALQQVLGSLTVDNIPSALANTARPRWDLRQVTKAGQAAPVSPKPGREGFLIRDQLFDLPESARTVAGLRAVSTSELLDAYRTFMALEWSGSDRELADHLWAPSNGASTELAHRSLISDTALWVLHQVGKRLLPRTDGLTVIEYFALAEVDGIFINNPGGLAFADNRTHGLVTIVQGFSPIEFPTRGDVLAHELGHECFLPHVRPQSEGQADPASHDPLDPNCLMSYRDPKHFCGVCVLRLRGWDLRYLEGLKGITQ